MQTRILFKSKKDICNNIKPVVLAQFQNDGNLTDLYKWYWTVVYGAKTDFSIGEFKKLIVVD